jgi:signal transduction histidine kinase/ActR/RegA family two-component response regulator
MADRDRPRNLEVLVFAPIGRDTALTVGLLERFSIVCRACRSIREVCDAVRDGAGAVLLTEEALADPYVPELASTLDAQPAWSGISVLLFMGDERMQLARKTLRTLETLGNVTLLDRPIRSATVVSMVRAALRARERQYELRDVLVALYAARRDAEEASRLKDEFLATLSHELRTPLNAVLGWVAMLRRSPYDEARGAKALEIIERNAQAQAQLISDVLDVSRMITGRIRLVLEPVALPPLLADAIESVRPAVEAKGIDVCLQPAVELPIVNGDSERLRQVFWNLLSNAVKFTPHGGRIDVTIRRIDSSLDVAVSDTGVGLSAEFLPHAFERFRQADQSLTRTHGGLGLGLAIVRHLVEMHGGHVAAESEGPGKGATFRVHLPIAAVVASPMDVSPSAPSAGLRGSTPEWPDFGERLILVVDDDATTRELLTAVLARCHARAIAVGSAQEALGRLEGEVPALILADIGMPQEDGLAMIRRIRQRPADRGGLVKSIALSAYARAEDRSAALTAGFDDFITKPVMPADLLRAVNRWLVAVR